MKLKTLLEEWKDSIKVGRYTYEIFKNPTQKELSSVAAQADKEGIRSMVDDDIRFIIDKKKKDLYVFSSLITHPDAASKLGIKYSDFEEEHIFHYGTYKKKKGKIKLGDVEDFPEATNLVKDRTLGRYFFI
ncbi:MAG TPA: hypothetical protein VMV95_00995 [Bacillota bacterium]|nr:hypothetical protein [Bacillota bacterium]